MRRVAITGMGIASCLGNDLDTVSASLREGRSGIRHLPEAAERGLRSQVGGPVDLDLDALIDRKLKRFMSDAAAYSYVSMRDAIADAGLDEAQVSHPRTGLIAGSGGGSSHWQVETADLLREKGVRKVGPYMVPRTMCSTVSANLATAFRIKGVSYSIGAACATSAHCIGAAADLIRHGAQDIVFAGGGEDLHWTMSVMFDAMGALSSSYNDTPEKASRPYDAGRDGFVIGEGAVMLVIETLASAKARGAKIYGTLAGYGISADSHDIVQPEPTGSGQFSAMVKAMRNAGLEPADVKHVNAHGTSTPQGDVTEARSIARALGSAADDAFVTSTKSMTGHLLGGTGALETFATVMALRDRISPPTINLENPEPDLGIQIAANTARELSSGPLAALNNSFGFGGHNVALALTNDNMTD